MDDKSRRVIESFNEENFRKYVWRKQKGKGGFLQTVRTLEQDFANGASDGSFFAFPKQVIYEFKHCLQLVGIGEGSYKVIDVEIPEPEKIEFKLKPKFKPRDEGQEKAIEFLFKRPPAGTNRKLLGLAPGEGKSFCSMWMAQEYSMRAVLITSSKYIEKWVNEYKEKCIVEEGDIIVLQGKKGIVDVMEMAKEKTLKAKIIIVSTETFRNYVKDYEFDKDAIFETGYLCSPIDFFAFISAGLLFIDEIHENIGFMIKLYSYLNIYCLVGMTGSLTSRDPFILKMQNYLFTLKDRFLTQVFKKSSVPYSLYYNHSGKYKFRYRGPMGYSQINYENSILKQPQASRRFNNVLGSIIKNYHFDKSYKKGDKGIVYCATRKMCDSVSKFLKEKFSDYNVKRYIQGDDYENNLIKPDIRVATLKIAGTAQDIKGLSTVLLTVATNSPISNLQSLGRLRPLEDGRDSKFLWMNCLDIAKHMDYDAARIKDIDNRTHPLVRVRLPNL